LKLPPQTGCGTQHLLHALSGARILLAAAPTTPPCFRHWRRSSLLRFGNGDDYFLFAAEKSLQAFLCCFFTRGGVTSKCIKEHKCSLPVLPHSVKMCLERPAGRDKHKQ